MREGSLTAAPEEKRRTMGMSSPARYHARSAINIPTVQQISL
jgi:hypothetical protein